jgi:hypothetical protein
VKETREGATSEKEIQHSTSNFGDQLTGRGGGITAPVLTHNVVIPRHCMAAGPNAQPVDFRGLSCDFVSVGF